MHEISNNWQNIWHSKCTRKLVYLADCADTVMEMQSMYSVLYLLNKLRLNLDTWIKWLSFYMHTVNMKKQDCWSNIYLYLLDIFLTSLFIDLNPNNILLDCNHLHYFLCAMYFPLDNSKQIQPKVAKSYDAMKYDFRLTVWQNDRHTHSHTSTDTCMHTPFPCFSHDLHV